MGVQGPHGAFSTEPCRLHGSGSPFLPFSPRKMTMTFEIVSVLSEGEVRGRDRVPCVSDPDGGSEEARTVSCGGQGGDRPRPSAPRAPAPHVYCRGRGPSLLQGPVTVWGTPERECWPPVPPLPAGEGSGAWGTMTAPDGDPGPRTEADAFLSPRRATGSPSLLVLEGSQWPPCSETPWSDTRWSHQALASQETPGLPCPAQPCGGFSPGENALIWPHSLSGLRQSAALGVPVDGCH